MRVVGALPVASRSAERAAPSRQQQQQRRRENNSRKANEKAMQLRKRNVLELSRRRDDACFGHCERCGKRHSLPRTREAEEEALALIARLREQKSVSDETGSDRFLVEDVYDAESGGKMIGVLICETPNERKKKVLKAFSGQWMGEWEVPGWCPPLAKLTHNSSEYIKEREKIESLSEEIKALEIKASSSLTSSAVDAAASTARELKTKRKNMSRALLEKIWDSYSLPNFRKEKHFSNDDSSNSSSSSSSSSNSNSNSNSSSSTSGIRTGSSDGGRKLIELNIRKCYHGDASKLPCGCGDCAAPKLLAECARRGWKPIAIAETWMGPNMKRGAGLREEGVFYGACLERCRPILGHMLCVAAL